MPRYSCLPNSRALTPERPQRAQSRPWPDRHPRASGTVRRHRSQYRTTDRQDSQARPDHRWFQTWPHILHSHTESPRPPPCPRSLPHDKPSPFQGRHRSARSPPERPVPHTVQRRSRSRAPLMPHSPRHLHPRQMKISPFCHQPAHSQA